jgi:uncharacterized protein
MFLKTFGLSFVVTVAVLAVSGIIGGGEVLAVVAILGVLEVSLSFDNAVVNATVLKRMSPQWQRIFLTVGILIAVFGMRLLFPLIVVAITAHLSPVKVVQLALNHPNEYANHLTAAHPAIAAFGGMFLLLIFLDFLLDERDITWLTPIEKALARTGRVPALSSILGLVLLFIAAETVGHRHYATVLSSGILGMATYLAVNALGEFFESEGDSEDEELAGVHGDAVSARGASAALAAGKAAFALFLYLEVLDASFSFDGVIGAFAISNEIFVIAAGLGIGAMFIRSLTVYLVRAGTLDEYVYLEHGAHYAIGTLAVIIFVSISHEVPEVVTGLIGVAFILLAFVSSLIRNRRQARLEPSPPALPEPAAVGD